MLFNLKKRQSINIFKSSIYDIPKELLEKAVTVPVGTRTQWGGKWYVKTNDQNQPWKLDTEHKEQSGYQQGPEKKNQDGGEKQSVDYERLQSTAGKVSTEDLQKVLKTSKDPKITSIAKSELKKRGENYDVSKNFRETLIDKHKDNVSKIKNNETALKYKEAIDQDQSLSSKEKKEIHRHIDSHVSNLDQKKYHTSYEDIVSGKYKDKDKDKDKEQKQSPPEKKEQADFSKLSENQKKERGWKQQKDGFYNPETGEGWDGDKDMVSEQEKKDIKTKVEGIEDAVFNIAKDNARKYLSQIGGTTGSGKTTIVRKTLQDMGFEKIDVNKDFDSDDYSGKGYVDVVGGNKTYTGLLKDLYKYRGNDNSNIIMNFDDSDGILVKATDKNADPKINNLFKVLGQDKQEREITIDDTTRQQISKEEGIDIPKSFKLYAKINFITNKDIFKDKDANENVAALARRFQSASINLDDKQSLFNMSKYLNNATINDKPIPFKEAKEYYDFIKDNKELVKKKSVISGNFFADLADMKDEFERKKQKGTIDFKNWQEYAENKLKL